MFVETESGTYINTSHVRSITPEELGGGYRRYEIVMTNGDVQYHRLEIGLFEQFTLSASVTPAAPGFERVEWSVDSRDQDYVSRQPVVGWRVDEFGAAIPVCITPSYAEEWAIIAPNGKLFVPGEGEMESIEEWRQGLADARKRRRSANTKATTVDDRAA